MKSIKAVIVTSALILAGCATIVGDRNQLIPISSTPEKADVTIIDERGNTVFSGRTPTTVTLQKSDGSYFGGKTYSVQIQKAGYSSQTITVTSSPNGWYLAGNFVFGGLLGWLVIDPLTGAMYNLSPENVNGQLAGQNANNDESANGISVVLLEDVPAPLREGLVALH
ncbi:hypothetical protein C5610_03435 [Idiomarina sp. OT37-5b]|uniref:PEGA domain-containing protein n=1 Tax=Idiomarina aquatica TaxID=1327752 RepID=A0AA94JEA5_9GAMM|nr:MULTISPECIES: hypothetical protein [Idiomarina]AVJ55437.1 hypothetical protein C5610_03435 [Idiomarina sp. OT37-5b]RUO44940.1 hypothetical protein CWE23_02620 [Idiomarina aquatica]